MSKNKAPKSGRGSDHLADDLHPYLLLLNKKFIAGHFLSRSDILVVLRTVQRKSGRALVEVHLPGRRQVRRVVSLCACVTQDGETVFARNADIDKTLERFGSSHVVITGNFFHLHLDVENPSIVPQSEIDLITLLLDFVINGTIQKANSDKDRLNQLEEAVFDKTNNTMSTSMRGIEDRMDELVKGVVSSSKYLSSAEIVFYDPHPPKNDEKSGSKFALDQSLSFRAAVAGCIKSGNIALYEDGDSKLLLMPIERAPQDRLLDLTNAVFVLESEENLSSAQFDEMSIAIRTYIRAYKEHLKNQLYIDLERYLFDYRFERESDLSWADIDQYISSALQRCGNVLMFVANAHSIVYRKFIASERALRRVVDLFHREGRPQSEYKDIPVRNVAKSCNAFTFVNCTYEEGSIYIPNVEDIPSQYKRRGLGGILRSRFGTRSELTIPIFFKGTPLGTVNIESAHRDNFSHDRQYIVQLLRMIGRFAESLITAFDARWIGEVAQSRAAMHEARQITYAEIYSPDIKPLDAKNVANVRTLHSLIETALTGSQRIAKEKLVDFVGRHTRDATKDFPQAHKNMHIHIDHAASFPMDNNAHVAYIVREQIRNYVRSYSALSYLIMAFYPSSKLSNKRKQGYLYLETRISDGDVSECSSIIGLRPLHFRGRQHLGLYLTGVLTRAAGGWMHIEQLPPNDGLAGSLAVTVRLPLSWRIDG
jgi:hypothetical protein